MAINTHGVVVVQTTEHAGRLAGGSHSLRGVSGWVVSATSDVAGVCRFAAWQQESSSSVVPHRAAESQNRSAGKLENTGSV